MKFKDIDIGKLFLYYLKHSENSEEYSIGKKISNSDIKDIKRFISSTDTPVAETWRVDYTKSCIDFKILKIYDHTDISEKYNADILKSEYIELFI